MLPSEIDSLIAEAEKAMDRALAPYSGYDVGAALLTTGGKIYRGCNLENPSLMLSFCAERAALVKALTEGEKHFRALAIVSGDGRYCYPCGMCRQMMAEFAPNIEIFLVSENGIRKYMLSELLPFPFLKQ